jgi:hypothetical protein
MHYRDAMDDTADDSFTRKGRGAIEQRQIQIEG